MKCQALFSLKIKKKYFKMLSAVVVIRVLKVNLLKKNKIKLKQQTPKSYEWTAKLSVFLNNLHKLTFFFLT